MDSDSDSDSEPGPSAPKKRIIFGGDSSSDSDSGPDDILPKKSSILPKKSSDDSDSGPDDVLPKQSSDDDSIDPNAPTQVQDQRSRSASPEEQQPKPAPAKKNFIDDDDSDDDIIKDDDDDRGNNKNDSLECDFDVMMQKKKDENRNLHNKRKKAKDIDMINDNDDAIAKLMADMRLAAQEDRDLNQKGSPAIKKLSMMPAVRSSLGKVDLILAFVEANILSVITDWLAPLPRDKSLPHLQIRDVLLKFLFDVPIDDYSRLKESGVGKAVMYLYRHPKNQRHLKDLCGKIIAKWSRPIFHLNSEMSDLSQEERIRRDQNMADHSSAGPRAIKRKEKADAILKAVKDLKPGDPGWIPRARVPMPGMNEYVNRPEWQSTVDMSEKALKRTKTVDLLEKHKRKFSDRKKLTKNLHAEKISIEGKAMNGF